MTRYGLFLIAVYLLVVTPSPCDGACRGRLFNRVRHGTECSAQSGRVLHGTCRCLQPCCCDNCQCGQPVRNAVRAVTAPVRAIAPVCGAGGCCK